MKVSDIKCFCKGTSTGDFLKKSEYSNVLTSLTTFKTNIDSTKATVDSELKEGGLSASALNFSGFSPLFEMGYQESKNIETATSSVDEVKSSIEDDANAHLTQEWGKYYQEVYKCTEEKRQAMESARDYYNSLSDDDSKKSSAYNSYKNANEEYKKHKEELETATSKYESFAGSGSAAKALDIDFTQTATKSGGYDLDSAKPDNLTPEQEKWIDDHIETIMDVCKEYGILPSVLLGQMVYECQWSTSDIGRNAHNLFGIKYTNGCGFGNYGGFRSYDSEEDSIRDYAKLLSQSGLYKGYMEGAKNWDYDRAVDGLYDGPYCPSSTYGPNVKSIIKKFGFDKYDEVLKNGGTGAAGLSSEYKVLSSMRESNKRTAETTSVKAKTRTFRGSGSGVINEAIEWGLGIANDNSYGYSQNRGDHEYDCSSLAVAMYKNAGVDVGGASYTGNMRECMTGTGNFEWIPGDPDPSTLQPGDIVLDEDAHTEIYIGDGKLLGAHDNYSGGAGDPSGEEIDVGNYYSHPWDGVLRYKG